jgi:hypothetical protein
MPAQTWERAQGDFAGRAAPGGSLEHRPLSKQMIIGHSPPHLSWSATLYPMTTGSDHHPDGTTPSIGTKCFRAEGIRYSRTSRLAGRTMYPVIKSPSSKDASRGRSRQWSAINTHSTESNLSWSAFRGWAVFPAMRHDSASSSQPSTWDSRAAARATWTQSDIRKVFLRTGLYLGALSRPKNCVSSDASARAGKTSIA